MSQATGTEHYALELIRALTRLNTQHRLTLYFRTPPPEHLFPHSHLVTQRIIPLARLWTHARFAAAIWRDQPDVAFVPAHTLPILFPGKAVVTIHDLGYKFFPQAHPPRQRLYLDWSTRYSARRATLIFADSQATASDLSRFYDTSADKIRVVYPGVGAPSSGGTALIRQKYHLPDAYFLFIGTLQPRKNIARIVQAYAQWKAAHPHDNTGLVLAGGKGWLYDEGWTAGVDGVYLTGYIDEADKGALYAGAAALVFPTLYEGFGFPVIEAMHCGTPVIASNTSSLPELVGDAGLLVNPLEVLDIAAALDVLSWNHDLRGELRQKGYAQAAKFTWQRAAEQVLSALESL